MPEYHAAVTGSPQQKTLNYRPTKFAATVIRHSVDRPALFEPSRSCYTVNGGFVRTIKTERLSRVNRFCMQPHSKLHQSRYSNFCLSRFNFYPHIFGKRFFGLIAQSIVLCRQYAWNLKPNERIFFCFRASNPHLFCWSRSDVHNSVRFGVSCKII